MKSIKIIKKSIHLLSAIIVMTFMLAVPAFSVQAAEVQPVLQTAARPTMVLSAGTGVEEVDSMFDNLYSFISGVVRIIGILVGLFGLVQIGISFFQHDASQRIQGFMFLAGGIVILFSPQILTFIQG